ncbi:MAG: phage late control D family protein [Lewinellaceae bacterium]|nr:phage late control D family protein [Lewinellaceae bacterium]
MTNARLIPAAGEPGVVAYSIRINGTVLPVRLPLYGLTVSKEVNRIPYAKLLITDGDPAKQDFEISNEDWFLPGNSIEISLGYLNGEARVFKGVIIRQQITIRQGVSLLEVDCRDVAYRMILRRQGRYFEQMTDSEVAAELLTAGGLKADVADTRYRHANLVQYDCTDWDFMVSRMEHNGLLTIVDDGVAHIQAPDFDQEPALHLQHGATVLEFDGGLEVRDQYEQVVARTWDPGTQTIVEITAKEPRSNKTAICPAGKLPQLMGMPLLRTGMAAISRIVNCRPGPMPGC